MTAHLCSGGDLTGEVYVGPDGKLIAELLQSVPVLAITDNCEMNV
jgi:hypothetical protein